MKVVKFGGSSLADANQVKKVCQIVLSDKSRRIVVVSAPGKRFDNDIKVTDLLIELAEKKRDNKDTSQTLDAIIDRFSSIAKDLELKTDIIDTIKEDILARLSSKLSSYEKFLDLMKAAGEDNSAKLVAYYLQSRGVDAIYVNPKEAGMYLSDEFGHARVLAETFDNLAKLTKRKEILIFPGFFGYSKDGDVVTFSRGGSDVTGSILAAAVGADVYENFTDVDYVYAANPNIVDNPKPIYDFTYEEMRELSYAGFSVLHEETLEPVYRKNIIVNIRNTNNLSSSGTYIIPRAKADGIKRDRPVVGIAADTGFLSIHVEKYMMNREIGFGRKLLTILEEEGVSYEHAPSGIDSISVIVKKKNCSDEKLNRIIGKIKDQLDVDDIIVEEGLAIVMLVGRGMSKTVGISSRATKALADSNINIRMINQGSSEVSVMFGISQDDAKKALTALYKEFFD